eukprot:gene6635-23144_t
MEGAAPTQVQVQVQEQEQEQEQPKHVRVPVVRQSKHKGAGSRKGAEVPLCSVCGTTKKNRAAVICSICGPLCFGCDLSKHPGEQSAADDGAAVQEQPTRSDVILFEISGEAPMWGSSLRDLHCSIAPLLRGGGGIDDHPSAAFSH